MIAVIDYGAGNLRSVINALEFIGQHPHVTNDPADLDKADALVLPGVGAFGDGIDTLRRLNLIEPLAEQVLVKNKPYLGICLGLQFLANESHEHGTHQGLGWLPGTVKRLQPNEPRLRVPHMGWNNVEFPRPSSLFDGIDADTVFYFVHSYHFVPKAGSQHAVVATAWHGETVVAAVAHGNIFGVQFHPEKSQKNGLRLLENFVAVI